jgi:hypothetical protein
MSKKYTYQEVKKIVEDLGYKLVSKEYIDIDSKLIFKDQDGYYYEMSLYGFHKKNNSQKFHPNNSFTIQNINLFLKSKNLNFIIVSDVYKSSKEKIILKDNEGFYYEITLSSLLNNNLPRRYDKANSYTTQNMKLWLKNNAPNYQLITNKYINQKSKITLSDKEGFYYFVLWESFVRSKKANRFDISNIYTIQNIRLWCNLNQKPFELLSDKYIDSVTHLKWKCLKKECNEIFEIPWSNIMNGQGCGYCAGKQVGSSNCLVTKKPELAKEWHPTKNGNLTPYNVTVSSGKYVWWKCKECGHEWRTKIATRNLNRGCPRCNESKGEKKIKEILDSMSEYYIPQKRFNNLLGLGNGQLSYDFYLPSYNFLIEYQGEYHESQQKHVSKKKFETQLEHDRRKREYAKDNNIKLLEIWYWDYENIEDILNKELNINSQRDKSTLVSNY